MKINRSVLGLVFLISLSMAKTIPTSTTISSTTDKKTVSQEEPIKPEVPQVPEELAVENADEPKQADRTKKSATTTFCVEVRPGQSDGPVKVCDEHNPLRPLQNDPQVPNSHHEVHQESHHVVHEHKLPSFIIPPNPLAIHIPNEGQSFVNYPSHDNNQVDAGGNAQHIIIPSSASFPYPSFSPSSQQIINPSSVSFPYPSSSWPSQQIINPSSASFPYPLFSPSSQQIINPSSASFPYPSSSWPSQQIINPSSASFLYPSSSLPSQHLINPSSASFPYPSSSSTSQQIINPSSASFPYPSSFSPSQHIINPSSQSFPYPSSSSPSQQIINPSPASFSDPLFSPPSQHIIIPSSTSSTSYPSVTSQPIVIPSTGSGLCSCPCPSNNGLYPQTLIPSFQSPMVTNNNNAPMELRGGTVDWINHIRSGLMLTKTRNQMAYGTRNLDKTSPFATPHTKKIYTVPSQSNYGSGGYQAKSPYVVQWSPQAVRLGGDGYGIDRSTIVSNSQKFGQATNSNMNNMEKGSGKIHQSPMNEDAQMNFGTTQEGLKVTHHIAEPMMYSSPNLHTNPSGYQQQHSTTYQTYQSRPTYSSHDSDYMVHPVSHFYRREGTQSLSMGNNEPVVNVQKNPSSDMEMQKVDKKSWNHQSENVQQKTDVSPSQMLNQMKSVGSNSGSSSFGTTNPVMQSFPRQHSDDSSPSNERVHVNMHIPASGQPFMITAPRNDNNMVKNYDGGEIMGKRETEKTVVSEIDA